MVGAEALVRWVHPEHGELRPVDFIREAETWGLIRDIDERVRTIAMAEAVQWPDRVTVGVNLSAADLDVPTLPEDVASGLAAEGLPASRLVLEVTETALSQDWRRARRRLEALEAVTTMAHKLDMEVLAEGIETEEQCAAVTAAGCDTAQGFLFAHPMDGAALAHTLEGSV